MSLEDLMRMMPPPKQPRHNVGIWEGLESELGTLLPEDYKAFIAVYGSGQIDNFLSVYNFLVEPERARADVRFLAEIARKCMTSWRT